MRLMPGQQAMQHHQRALKEQRQGDVMVGWCILGYASSHLQGHARLQACMLQQRYSNLPAVTMSLGLLGLGQLRCCARSSLLRCRPSHSPL